MTNAKLHEWKVSRIKQVEVYCNVIDNTKTIIYLDIVQFLLHNLYPHIIQTHIDNNTPRDKKVHFLMSNLLKN